MTHSNNITRARVREAMDAEKGSHVYMLYSNHQPPKPITWESFAEMADAHDRSYRATWSAQDTEPEDSIDAYRLLYGNSIKVAVIASAIIFTAFGLGLGYLLFHP